MKKNLIIIILVVLLLGLGGYLVYDKVVDKDENNIINETVDQEENFDLSIANELVDRYVYFSRYLGGDIFRTGLTDELKMLIALNNVPAGYVYGVNCDAVYGEKYDKEEYGEYYITFDMSNTFSAVCGETSEKIAYLDVSPVYKDLFGGEMPKKDLIIGTYRFDYIEANDAYYSLSCNCGGVDDNIYMHGVKAAKLNGDKLIVDMGYYILKTTEEDYSKYSCELNNKTYSDTEVMSEDFEENFINENLDKMDTYKFTFIKEKGHYILEGIVKE